MLPPCVLWMDPGGMTGLAWLWQLGGGSRFWAGEWPFQEAGECIEDTCQRYGPLLWIGWETYRARPGEPQHNARDAIEPIGMARYLAGKHGCRVLQEADRHTPDADDQAMLRAAGWWVPGKDDAQAAATHMMRWLRKTGQMPPEVAAKMSAAAGTVRTGKGNRKA